MARVLLKAAFVVTLLLFGLLAVVHAAPREDAALQSFLHFEDNSCALPCWFGIEPGVTRIEDALTILRAHPWVARAHVEGDISSFNLASAVVWEWNGAQPDYIDPHVEGSAAAQYNTVQYISIMTRVPMGDMQAVYGAPPRGGIARAGLYQSTMFHYAVYGGVRARNLLRCPLRLATAWFTPVQINLAPEASSEQFDPYDLRLWLHDMTCGR